jgi:hypothetical protein
MMSEEEEAAILAALEEEVKYQHATCSTVHPRGTLQKADLFRTICGELVPVGSGDKPCCPKCEELHKAFLYGEKDCTMCGKNRRDHA